MNDDVQYDIAALEFNNGEQLENFHIIIIILQQEITLYGETVSPKRRFFKYIKALSKSNKLKSFIAPKMTDLITFLDNNRKYSVYKGVNIRGLYHYLDMIRDLTILTTPGQRSHNFGP